jgi:hypothetical protein
MQAPVYTPTTGFADDERNNAGGRSTIHTDRLDAELAAASTSINALGINLAKIQRDDGKLQDQIIENYNFSAAAKAYFMATKWTARGLWTTATAYAVNDMVDVAGAAYVVAIAHTSGVFATDYAAGRLQIFVTSITAAGLIFAPTSTITATNTQAAIAEVDTKHRAMALPLLNALYGGF